jgi:hypothetical protein
MPRCLIPVLLLATSTLATSTLAMAADQRAEIQFKGGASVIAVEAVEEEDALLYKVEGESQPQRRMYKDVLAIVRPAASAAEWKELRIAQAMGDWSAAAGAATRATLTGDWAVVPATLALVDALERQGAVNAEAVRVMTIALNAQPKHRLSWSLRYRIGVMQAQLGDKAATTTADAMVVDARKRIDGEATVAAVRAAIAIKSGQNAEALIRRAAGMRPTDENGDVERWDHWLRWLAKVASSQGKARDELAIVDQALATLPMGLTGPWHLRRANLLKSSDLDAALAAAVQADLGGGMDDQSRRAAQVLAAEVSLQLAEQIAKANTPEAKAQADGLRQQAKLLRP